MKELARNARSTFSAGDFHSADHILAAVGFLRVFQREFLRNYSLYRAQNFRAN